MGAHGGCEAVYFSKLASWPAARGADGRPVGTRAHGRGLAGLDAARPEVQAGVGGLRVPAGRRMHHGHKRRMGVDSILLASPHVCPRQGVRVRSPERNKRVLPPLGCFFTARLRVRRFLVRRARLGVPFNNRTASAAWRQLADQFCHPLIIVRLGRPLVFA